MKLTCDLCGSALQMNPGGQGATCTVCGLGYTMERLREKLNDQNGQQKEPPKPDPPKPVPPKPVPPKPVPPKPVEDKIYDVVNYQVISQPGDHLQLARNNVRSVLIKEFGDKSVFPDALVGRDTATQADFLVRVEGYVPVVIFIVRYPADTQPYQRAKQAAKLWEARGAKCYIVFESDCMELRYVKVWVQSAMRDAALPAQEPPKADTPKPEPPKPRPSFDFVPKRFVMKINGSGFRSISGWVQQGGIGLGDNIYIDGDYAHPYRVGSINDDPNTVCAKEGMPAELFPVKCPKKVLMNAHTVSGKPNPVANAYNYPGTVREYFTNLLLSEFPRYELQTDVSRDELNIPVSFMLCQGGKPVTAVFLTHSNDKKAYRQVEKAARIFASEGISCTNFYENYRNDKPYVIQRVRGALG